MRVEIIACPFCGDLESLDTFIGHEGIQFFHCDERKAGCGLVASFSPRKAGHDAACAWNKRVRLLADTKEDGE